MGIGIRLNDDEALEVFNSIMNSEWNDELNIGVDKNKVGFKQSQPPFWWTCRKCGGNYKQTVNLRTKRKYGCPYCAGKRLLTGYNDLQSKFPNIAKDWDYSKNGELTPKSVFACSNTVVWWICEQGHSWKTPIQWRTSCGNGCPYCNNNQTSYPEQLVYTVLKQKFPKAVNRFKVDKVEYDIIIPELKLFIEYDGAHWHGSELKKEMELAKETEVLKYDYYFLRIVEVDTYTDVTLEKLGEHNYRIITPDIKCKISKSNNLLKILDKYLAEQFNIKINTRIDVGMYDKILKQAKTMIKSNNIAITNPELVDEWVDDANIQTITPGVDYRAKWKCRDCGNVWRTAVRNRTKLGSGCPECAKRKRADTRRQNKKQ